MIGDRRESQGRKVLAETVGASPTESGAVKIQAVRIIEEKQFPKE